MFYVLLRDHYTLSVHQNLFSLLQRSRIIFFMYLSLESIERELT